MVFEMGIGFNLNLHLCECDAIVIARQNGKFLLAIGWTSLAFEALSVRVCAPNVVGSDCVRITSSDVLST